MEAIKLQESIHKIHELFLPPNGFAKTNYTITITEILILYIATPLSSYYPDTVTI